MNLKKYILSLFCVILSLSSLYSQAIPNDQVKKLDSLEQIISDPAVHDTMKWVAQIKTNEILQGYDLNKALTNMISLVDDLQKERESKSQLDENDALFRISMNALFLMSELYGQNQEEFSGLKILEDFLLETEHYGIKPPASLVNRIARRHKRLRNYEQAITYFELSFDRFVEEKDSLGASALLVNIGLIYSSMEQYDKAMKCFENSLRIKEEINHVRGVFNCNRFIGLVLRAENKDSLALTHILTSYSLIKELEKELNSAQELSQMSFYVFEELGDVYLALDSLEKAHLFYDLAEAESNKFNFPLDRAATCIFKINFYTSVGQYEELKPYLKKSENLLSTAPLSTASQKSVHHALYKGYKAIGQFDQAYEHYDQHLLLKDSINRLADQKAFLYRQMSKENETELMLAEADNKRIIDLKKEEGKKQEIIGYFVLGGTIFLLLFLFFTYNRLRIVRRQKSKIEDQKAEISKVHVQLEEHHRDIQDSIQYAKHIQNAVLPTINDIKNHLGDSFVFYQPKDVVAGDFFWMEVSNTNSNTVYYSVADCTGHGVPGALVSLVCSNALTKALKEEKVEDTGLLLDRTREIVINQLGKRGQTVKDGMDASLCSLNKKTNTLNWSGANNSIWIFRDNDQDFEVDSNDSKRIKIESKENLQFLEIKGDRQPVGLFAEARPFNSYRIKVNKGDVIYLFSDGYADQFGGKSLPSGRQDGKKFKTANLKKLLFIIASLPMDEQKNKLRETFDNWRGDLEQLDDVCIMGVKV